MTDLRIRQESLADLLPDALGLFQKHHVELGDHQEKMPLEPDYGAYKRPRKQELCSS